LIGLPYSGFEEVAKMFKDVYGCDIFRADLEEKPAKLTIGKYVR